MKRLTVIVAFTALFVVSLTVSADPGDVHITGAGVVEIDFGESDIEVISFSVTAVGGQPLPSEEIPATGQIHLASVIPFGGPDWQLSGSVICMRDLSPFFPPPVQGVWEVRFVTDQSTRPYLPVGKHASIYFKDDPSGDSVSYLDADISWDDITCGPRGGMEDLKPLISGDVAIAFGTFSDDDQSLFETDIEWLVAQGVTKGCSADGTLYCPDDLVTRGQMAAFLVRAFGYTDNGRGNLFTDDDGSIFEDDIDKLATAGVTQGCGPGLYCPDNNVTRGQMAAFLHRALG